MLSLHNCKQQFRCTFIKQTWYFKDDGVGDDLTQTRLDTNVRVKLHDTLNDECKADILESRLTLLWAMSKNLTLYKVF